MSPTRRRTAPWLSVFMLTLAAGCYQSHSLDGGAFDASYDGTEPGDTGPRDSGPRDSGPRDTSVPPPDAIVPPPITARVDVLFVVDNSNSMLEEQVSLKERFPELIESLTSGLVHGAHAGDLRSFPAVGDLHFGVVDTDMGTGGFLVPTCSESNFGDDGILQTHGDVSMGGCSGTYPSFLSFRFGDNSGTFAADASCLASLGTGGCGFEQPLEAALKAVTPSTLSTTFVMGTRGHGDVENAGFLRPDSILAVVVLSDENDCSASDPLLFDPSSPRYMGDLNLRCFQFPETLYPTDRYVTGLLALRPDPSRLVFSAIVGVPVDLTLDPSTTHFGTILDDPRMRETVNPATLSNLTPSCDVTGRGRAYPPRRAVTVARDLERAGAHTTVGSICQSDYSAPIRAIVNQIADAIEGG